MWWNVGFDKERKLATEYCKKKISGYQWSLHQIHKFAQHVHYSGILIWSWYIMTRVNIQDTQWAVEGWYGCNRQTFQWLCYISHCLRRGITSHIFEVGIKSEYIKMMEAWASQLFFQYLDLGLYQWSISVSNKDKWPWKTRMTVMF